MRSKILACFLLGVLFVWPLQAMETDQYNLPPVPLEDVGDEVSEYVEKSLYRAVAKVNGDIAFYQECINTAAVKEGCRSAEKANKKVMYLRSNDAVAKELYEILGEGNIFVSHIGQWMNSHQFRSSPSSYKAEYLESIFIAEPIDYATLSPTVKLFGVEFGTDKLDHFFQQGYRYYKIEKKAAAKGSTPHEAAKKAINWGQMTERTYFGLLVSGVFSNADLYANYAGMRFYQGLTRDDQTRSAILVLDNGKWKLDAANLRENLIKPFISEHLNEALNPSGYAFTIYGSVRRAVQKNGCPEWRKLLPDATKADLESRSASLEKWNGEDYGFAIKGRSVSIASCFDER
jgi:hypothetical protein